MKYKRVIKNRKEVSFEEAEKKFSWLKEAEFENAEIDISYSYLVWFNGVWLNGIWVDGLWKNGEWHNGMWSNGIWRNGIWLNGTMWSNVKQEYCKVEHIGNVFRELK